MENRVQRKFMFFYEEHAPPGDLHAHTHTGNQNWRIPGQGRRVLRLSNISLVVLNQMEARVHSNGLDHAM